MNYLNNRYNSEKSSDDKSETSSVHRGSLMNKKEEKCLGAPIKNDIGEQNCFLNVLIHALYHIKEIKKFFIEEEIKNEFKLNIFAELQIVLERYSEIVSQFSKLTDNQKIIDPFELRMEFAKLFKEDGKFQLNKMDDPVEALFAILNAFHSYSVNAQSLKYVIEKPCNPPCLAHNLFWINILEQFECECGATSEVLKYDYNYFFYEAYVKEILIHTQKLKELKTYQNKFFNFLKTSNSQTTNACPEKCRLNKVRKNLFLLNLTPYLCFNLVWRESNPKLTDICKLFLMLPLKFKNKDLFELADNKNSATYELFGLVCYWGAHYICFFKNEDSEGTYWVNYDDTISTKILSWRDLVIKCVRSHFHPTILFYRKLDSDKYFSSLSDIKNETTDQDWMKILDYCIKYDKENEYPYKNEELGSSRLRPSSSNKKKSDDELTKIIKLRNSQVKPIDTQTKESLDDEELKFENIKKQAQTDQKNSILINLDNNKTLNHQLKSEIVEEKKTAPKNIDINPAEDEWICEKEDCQNINKNDTFTCLKCKEINYNIYDLILQRKYASRSNPGVKSDRGLRREQSMPQRSLDLSNSRSNINKDTSPNLYCVCENCQHANFYWKLECNNCKGPIKQPQSYSNQNVDKISNKKPSLYGYVKPSVGLNSKYSNCNYNNSNYDKENIDKSLLQTWLCKNCKHSNKNSRDYCEKCYMGRENIKYSSTLDTPKQQNSFLSSNKMNSSINSVNSNLNKSIRINQSRTTGNNSTNMGNQNIFPRGINVNNNRPIDTSMVKKYPINPANNLKNSSNYIPNNVSSSINNRSRISTNISSSINRSTSSAYKGRSNLYRK